MPFRRWLGTRRTPGGSRVYDYTGTAGEPHVGVVRQYTEKRETVYERFFGRFEVVHHETVPFVPHIDVYPFPPSEERPFFTLVTGG
jgi:hypothetical protein